MRQIIRILLAVAASAFILGGVLSCQAAPPDQTAQEDESVQAGDTTQPAVNEPPSVLVLPFQNLTGERRYDWIGPAMQQTLTADLSRTRTIGVITPATQVPAVPVSDLQSAMEAGRKAQAGLVVYGSYQYAEPDLRVTGQLIDAQRGQVLGSLKATGPLKQLFALEDNLTSQLVGVLKQNELAGAAPATRGSYAYSPGEADYSYAGYPTGYRYAYPYYPYYYPYYYPAAYPYCWYSPWYPSFYVSVGVGVHHHFGGHGEHFRGHDEHFGFHGEHFRNHPTPWVGGQARLAGSRMHPLGAVPPGVHSTPPVPHGSSLGGHVGGAHVGGAHVGGGHVGGGHGR